MPKQVSIYAVVILLLSAFLLSSCEMPEQWNDPVYFGPSEDLGKNSKGSGTGYETWKFDW